MKRIENVLRENDKIKILAIGGVSGAGKTVLAMNLHTNYSEYFVKASQVTTREMRASETNRDYLFLDKYWYGQLELFLIAKTCVNNNYYGTLLNMKNDRFNVVVVNTIGIMNLREFVRQNKDKYELYSICLNNPYAVRDNRNIEEEKDILTKCKYVYNMNDKTDYLTPDRFFDILSEIKE